MAIYDNDGTTSYEIGKIYDNDGTTNYQIGKVYDFDGTTNQLIYNATIEFLFDNGNQNFVETGGWSKATKTLSHVQNWTDNTQGYVGFGTEIVLTSGDTGQYRGATTRINKKVDFTDVVEIKITYKPVNATDYCYMPCCIFDDFSAPMLKYQLTNVSRQAAQYTTSVVDCRNITGEHYFAIGIYATDSDWFQIHIKDIKCISN